MERRKIIITGTTCTGKTTLGRKLSKGLSIPQIDLDNFYFLPNWVEKEKEKFVQDVVDEVGGKKEWIVTGSYQTLLKDTIWQQASVIVWLDYPLSLIVRRYLIRTFKRVVFREKCCGENYETLGRTFSKNSLFLWIFKSYWRRKERMKNWKQGEFAHKEWIVLTSPKSETKLLTLL